MKITKTQLRRIVKEEILNEVNSSKQLQELFGIGDKIAKSSFGKKAAKLGRTAQAKANRAFGQGGETELTYTGNNHKALYNAFDKMVRYVNRNQQALGDDQNFISSELDQYRHAFSSKGNNIVPIAEDFQDYLQKLIGNAEPRSFEHKFLDALAAWVSQLEIQAEEKKGSEGIRVGEFGDNRGKGGGKFLIDLANQLDPKGNRTSS